MEIPKRTLQNVKKYLTVLSNSLVRHKRKGYMDAVTTTTRLRMFKSILFSLFQYSNFCLAKYMYNALPFYIIKHTHK